MPIASPDVQPCPPVSLLTFCFCTLWAAFWGGIRPGRFTISCLSGTASSLKSMKMLLITSSSVLQGVTENKKTDTAESDWACCPLWSYFSCDKIVQQGLVFILVHGPNYTLNSAAFSFISHVQGQDFYLLLRFLVNISYRKGEFLPRDEVAHGHDTCGTSGTLGMWPSETTGFSLKRTGLGKTSTAISLIMVR